MGQSTWEFSTDHRDSMTSPAMRLLTLSLLLPLITSDYVRQYVEHVEAGGTEDQSIRVIRATSDPDKDPMDYMVGSVSHLVKMTRSLIPDQLRTALRDNNVVIVGRVASLLVLGLYILSHVTSLILPVIIWIIIFTFPDIIKSGRSLLG